MMLNFEVHYNDGKYFGASKVYAIDTVRDRFLVVNARGIFQWVNTENCVIKKKEEKNDA